MYIKEIFVAQHLLHTWPWQGNGGGDGSGLVRDTPHMPPKGGPSDPFKCPAPIPSDSSSRSQ